MQKIFENYIQSISSKFSHIETSEMGYRADFETLLKGIFEQINVKRIDHDARTRQGNRPDFIILNYDVPILYLETKDIGTSLDKIEKSEQMTRYYGYENLVLTDYLEFRFYRDGVLYQEPIQIATYDIKSRTIKPIPDNYKHVATTLLDFTTSHKEPIKSGKHLSQIMGGKAQRIRDNVRQFFATDPNKNAELIRVYETIKKLLVHDLSHETFADMYAQTLVYGLFVARFHDESDKDFTRQEARDLIPKSNPLLRHFFDHIVGPDFDKRLEYIVNELCEVFSHANVQLLMKEYFKDDLWGETHRDPDPVIHFYEDFLKEYDPGLRKKLGAYYTPLPVVQFIVRSVDHLLKIEFGLPAGLADTSKTISGTHKVQILDPAVGTGTFISTVIGIIFARLKQSGQKGRWATYVHNDLLPRLHGFELMMAPYTIAHLKLSMAFKETGFKYFNRRLGIYLTNSLEESATQENLFTSFGFAESIAEESKEASIIKNKTPIMVVIGNPPYNVSSSNRGEWIQTLIKDYKQGLNERKINLDDDYIKFIRFAEQFIEKNRSGIIAMITNNSFIDGITHRQMRKHLLRTFNDIYIINLHGDSNKNEKAPDGGKDENVFNIQQGVAISVFVRFEDEKKDLGSVYYSELYGKREKKFKILNENNIRSVKWKRVNFSDPYYFFVPKDFKLEKEYNKGFRIDDLFTLNSSGIETQKDAITIQFSKKDMDQVRRDFLTLKDDELANKYNISNTRDWNITNARGDLEKSENNVDLILYRLFDIRYTHYSGVTNGFMAYPRNNVMKEMAFSDNNIALQVTSKNRQTSLGYFWVSKYISDRHLLDTAGDSMSVFPLYRTFKNSNKVESLLNEHIVTNFEKRVGKVYPDDIFNYVYAVLYSPLYREKYKDFLKINFPRLPYPGDVKNFNKLVALGAELRSLHLLESPNVNQFITTYPEDGSNIVERVEYVDGKVFINKNQYFGKVPESAWKFYIGGYQPAQKWLKDRKGRTLTNSDIEHYQKIIVALTETVRIMKQIDQLVYKLYGLTPEDIKIVERRYER